MSEKATALAGELDVKVGRVMSISETSWGGTFSGGYNGGSRGGYGGQNVSQSAGNGNPEDTGTLSVGLISVGANVELTFVLE